MSVNKEDRIQDRREYGRAYYWKNIDTIKQKYREQADVANKSKKVRRADLVMLTDWLRKLQDRLTDQELDGWLRWALELTRSKIIDKIDELNGKEYRTVNPDDRSPNV